MLRTGRHLLAELWDCEAALDDPRALESAMRRAAEAMELPVLHAAFRDAGPQGVSGVLLVAAAHLSIHAWPQTRHVAVDVYTTGDGDPRVAHALLVRALRAARHALVVLDREAGHAPRITHERAITPEGATTTFVEDLVGGAYHHHGARVLAQTRTPYCDLAIVDAVDYGRMLVLDGSVQSSEHDEGIYHEALVAPAFVLASRSPRRVAILGGGEGATLREVLRFPSVESCVMIDIDDTLIELCRTHLPHWPDGAFEDPRTTLRVEDARAWLERERDCYDLIIGDLPDAPVGSALEWLYSAESFGRVRDRLAPGGLFVAQCGGMRPDLPGLVHASQIAATARGVFEQVRMYTRYVRCFRDMWCWILAGERLEDLDPPTVDARLAERRDPRAPTQHYDGETHRHMFSLPAELRAERAPSPAAGHETVREPG